MESNYVKAIAVTTMRLSLDERKSLSPREMTQFIMDSNLSEKESIAVALFLGRQFT